MSYREMRVFTEKLRELGYPNMVSMESFRNPNFNLASDILYWLVKSYEPGFEFNMQLGSEEERIQFIKSTVTLLVLFLNGRVSRLS